MSWLAESKQMIRAVQTASRMQNQRCKQIMIEVLSNNTNPVVIDNNSIRLNYSLIGLSQEADSRATAKITAATNAI